MTPYALSALAVLLLAAWLYSFFRVISQLVIPAGTHLPDGSNLFWFFSTVGALITSVSIVELGVKEPGGTAPKFGMMLSPRTTAIPSPQWFASMERQLTWHPSQRCLGILADDWG